MTSVLRDSSQTVTPGRCGCRFHSSVELLQPAGNQQTRYLLRRFYIMMNVMFQWALDIAKHNLVSKYLVVGVTEDLVGLVQVLEELLPHFFSGATQYLQDTGKDHIKHTKHKDPVSEETMRKMKKTKIWKMENEFYNFALKQFNAIKSATLEQHKMKTSFFNYEKVRRPK